MAVQVLGKISFQDRGRMPVTVKLEGEGESAADALRSAIDEYLSPTEGVTACDAIDVALRQLQRDPRQTP